MHANAVQPSSAALIVVPGATESAPNRYLQIAPDGAAVWVEDPESATPFASMREAARMAFRLPARLRAFGLPRASELALKRLH